MGCINTFNNCHSPIVRTVISQGFSSNQQNKKQVQKQSQAKVVEKLPKNIIKCQRQISDNKFLQKFIQKHVFFSKLLNKEKEEIFENVIMWKCSQSMQILKQRESIRGFFIIVEGSVQIKINEVLSKKLKKGDCFGELALIYPFFQTKSVFANSNSKFFFMGQSLFKKTIQQNIKKFYEILKESIIKIPTLAYLNESQKMSIIYSVRLTQFFKQQIIFNDPNTINSLFIIVKGRIQVSNINNQNVTLSINQSFGYLSLLKQEINITKALALIDSFCFVIQKQSIQDILGSNYLLIIYNNLTKWILKHSLVFSNFQNSQIDQILRNRNYIFYNHGELILAQNQQANKLIVCLEGKVNDISAPCIIGQSYFLKINGFYQKNLKKTKDGIITIIKKQQLENLAHKKNARLSTKKRNNQSQLKLIKDFNYLELSKLIYIKKLGQGQFGSVYLVKQSTAKQNLYAIKCIKKQLIIQHHLQKIVMQEKYILQLINFPFIINFVKSFKDDNYIYLLTEYIEGINLFQAIRQIGILPKNIAQFYLSSLILIVEYLNSKNIIHRDLKPQNILVQLNGYIKLVDMGSAKHLRHNTGFRTFTVIGTPYYMAPEIMQGKGYSIYPDLWSLGIILYEFICGKVPFGQDQEDPFKIHKQIINNELKYPDFMRDNKAKSLLNQLLNKNPYMRLDKGFESLKNHRYFENLDWQNLKNKSMKAQYIPKFDQQKYENKQLNNLFVNVLNKHNCESKITRKSQLMEWDQNF